MSAEIPDMRSLMLRGSVMAAAAMSVLAQAPQTRAEPVCKPVLTIKDAKLSDMRPPTLERRWSATVSVDASHCAPNASGYFEIGFLRMKENALELEFREEFAWLSPSVQVSVDFWADEAVEHSWIDRVTTCPCVASASPGATR